MCSSITEMGNTERRHVMPQDPIQPDADRVDLFHRSSRYLRSLVERFENELCQAMERWFPGGGPR